MTPLDRFTYYTDRISQANPKLNAFLDLRLEPARKEAEASQARIEAGKPLSDIDGLCVGVKCNVAVAGLPCHAGIEAYRNEIAAEDAAVVQSLKAAGAAILGTLNMHEGALGATTDNEAFGRCHNPWGSERTPGGSSGGSGAAVAAGLCDMAIGSDTMGSVRIPAAYCGVQGHKPTTGLVPIGGVLPLSHTLDHIGPLCRNVSMLRSMLSAMTGQSVAAEQVALQTLRIGIWDGNGQVELTANVTAGFKAAITALEQTGATCQPVAPPDYLYSQSRRAGLVVSEVEGHAQHAARLAEAPDGFSPTFRSLLEWGARNAHLYEASLAHIGKIRTSAQSVWRDVDVILAPTAPQQAFNFAEDAPANQADFTAWANFAHLPATALFTGVSADGLPLSLQVIGPEGQDSRTLAVAAKLEALYGTPPPPPGFA